MLASNSILWFFPSGCCILPFLIEILKKCKCDSVVMVKYRTCQNKGANWGGQKCTHHQFIIISFSLLVTANLLLLVEIFKKSKCYCVLIVKYKTCQNIWANWGGQFIIVITHSSTSSGRVRYWLANEIHIMNQEREIIKFVKYRF